MLVKILNEETNLFFVNVYVAVKLKKFVTSDCRYSGLQPDQSVSLAGVTIRMNGIDRVDSSVGYISENCVTCHRDINRMKSNKSVDEFVELCNLVSHQHRPS